MRGLIYELKNFKILALMGIILLGFTLSGKAQNDLADIKLTDSVKSIREIVYSTSGTSGSTSEKMITFDNYTTFNADGNKLETLIYKKGRLYSTLRFEYNQKGVKTGYREYDAKERLYIIVSYSYDESGRLVEEHYDRSLQKTYDDLRQEIDVEYDKYYQNLYTNIHYEYNLKGLIVAKQYNKPDSTLSFRDEFQYDPKGYLNVMYHINEFDKVTQKVKFINDLDGNPIQIQRFAKNRLESTSIIKYEFDAHNNWISSIENVEYLDNVFEDKSESSTITTIREIEYYSHPGH